MPKPYDVRGAITDPIEFITAVGADVDADIRDRARAWDYLDEIRTGRSWDEPLPDIEFLAELFANTIVAGGQESGEAFLHAVACRYGIATKLAVFRWLDLVLPHSGEPLH